MQQVAIMGFGGTDKSIFSDLYVVRTDGILMTVTHQNVNAVNMSKAAPQLQSEMYFLKALYSHLRDILSASKLISLNEMGLLADTGTFCICIK